LLIFFFERKKKDIFYKSIYRRVDLAFSDFLFHFCRAFNFSNLSNLSKFSHFSSFSRFSNFFPVILDFLILSRFSHFNTFSGFFQISNLSKSSHFSKFSRFFKISNLSKCSNFSKFPIYPINPKVPIFIFFFPDFSIFLNCPIFFLNSPISPIIQFIHFSQLFQFSQIFLHLFHVNFFP